MKQWSKLNYIFINALIITFVFVSCDYGDAPSLFNPEYESGPAPVISSIDPPDLWYGGIGSITITGENFSPEPENNLVYFNDKRGQTLDATATELRVRPPVMSGKDINVRVTVLGSTDFSNGKPYELELAAERWGGLSDAEQPGGIAFDDEGNLYVGVFNSNTARTDGIIRITPDREKSVYGQANHLRVYNDIKFGPDGYLYSVQGTIRLIARVPPGGGSEENWMTTLPAAVNLSSIEFDEYGYLWGVGNNENIYRIQVSDRSFTAFPFTANLRSVRYFNGYLYVSGRMDTNNNIWRFPVDGNGDLGDPEVYFAFTNEYNVSGARAHAINFAHDGTLYIGTNTPDGILKVSPDKSWEPLYPGLMAPRNIAFAWDNDTNLFTTRQIGDEASETKRLWRINTLKEGAPYYR